MTNNGRKDKYQRRLKIVTIFYLCFSNPVLHHHISSGDLVLETNSGGERFWVICQKVKVKNFHFNRLPKHLPPNLDLNLDQIFASVSPFQLEKNDIVGSQETTSNWGQHSVFCQYSLANVHIVILQGYLSLLWMEWVYQIKILLIESECFRTFVEINIYWSSFWSKFVPGLWST